MGKKLSTASRSRSLARHTPSSAATVMASVDKGMEKRWKALIEEVRRARGKEASGFDAMWEAVGEIIDHDLHLLGGFKDARDFFDRELNEKERNAYRFIKVARFASPRDEELYASPRSTRRSPSLRPSSARRWTILRCPLHWTR